jgi:hypothetical protein
VQKCATRIDSVDEIIPPITTSPAVECLLDTVNREHWVTAIQDPEASTKLISLTKTSFYVKTLRRALRGSSIKAVTKQKRPQLKPRHKRLRREFAEAHNG